MPADQLYWAWLNAQYTVGTETDGPGKSYPPVASAGPNQTGWRGWYRSAGRLGQFGSWRKSEL